MRAPPTALSQKTHQWLLSGGAALALTLGSVPAAAAEAQSVRASYEVYFGGFHVLNAEAQMENGGEVYSITAEAETQGMLGWFFSWKGETESRGLVAGNRIIPQRHDNFGTSDRGDREVKLRYDTAGDITEALVQPEQDLEDHHPLPAYAGEGTLDPLSVVAGLATLLQQGGPCDGSFAVFDGRRRYDLTVTDAGTATLEPNAYSIFEGEARGCHVSYELLGGHRVERNKYAATARDRTVWVARPAEGAPLIPVRLSIETDYGTVMGHLTGYSLGAEAKPLLTD